MIAKVLVSAAIALGAAVVVAAPANADPNFSNLSCSCRQTPPNADPVVTENQGIQAAETELLQGI